MSTNNNSSIYTENWLPVKSIENNIIMLDNKKMVTGVKIQPRNIFILDEQTQNNVIDALKTFYNLIDYEFWLIVADRPVDINLYISQLQLKLNDAQSPVIRKLIFDDVVIRVSDTYSLAMHIDTDEANACIGATEATIVS